MEINVCSIHNYLLLSRARNFLISSSLLPRAFVPDASRLFSAERPENDVKNSQQFFLHNDKQRNKHTKYIMNFVICQVNGGVGAVAAIKDYLLETQNTHKHLFEQLCSIQEIFTHTIHTQ